MAVKGSHLTREHRLKISKRLKGHKVGEETLKKKSWAMRAFYAERRRNEIDDIQAVQF